MIKHVKAFHALNNVPVEDINSDNIFLTSWVDYRLKIGSSTFLWIYDSEEEELLNTVRKYKNKVKGRFIRTDRYNVSPFTFGAQGYDRDNTFTLGALNFKESELHRLWGDRIDINLGDTPDYAGLTYAISLIGHGYNNINLYGKTYVVTRDVPLGAAEGTLGTANMIEDGVKLIDLHTGNARKFVY